MQKVKGKKVLFEGLAALSFFLAAWVLLSEVDWLKKLNINKVSYNTEEKLGDLFWENIERTQKKLKNKPLKEAIDSLFKYIGERNNVVVDTNKLHVVWQNEVNAFALPGGHIVLHSALIKGCKNQEALAAVICHELAHQELNHVSKKLIKEIGLGALMATLGGGGADVILQSIQILSSSAYDRSLESDADKKAVEYMLMANLDPEAFADFLLDLSNQESEKGMMQWMSSHPDSEQRAYEILDQKRASEQTDYDHFIDPEQWQTLVNSAFEKED